MRSAQECAEAARRFIRLAARESDPALKRRLLGLAKANQALARLANLLAKKSQRTTSAPSRRFSRQDRRQHDVASLGATGRPEVRHVRTRSGGNTGPSKTLRAKTPSSTNPNSQIRCHPQKRLRHPKVGGRPSAKIKFCRAFGEGT
jgi:hypothetical protein